MGGCDAAIKTEISTANRASSNSSGASGIEGYAHDNVGSKYLPYVASPWPRPLTTLYGIARLAAIKAVKQRMQEQVLKPVHVTEGVSGAKIGTTTRLRQAVQGDYPA